MIKTRLQIYDLNHSATPDSQPLLNQQQRPTRPSSFSIARSAYQTEGAAVFFRGIGICSARAFIVNAVQWGVSASYLGGINSTQDCANSVLCTGLRVDHEKPQLGSSAFGSLKANTLKRNNPAPKEPRHPSPHSAPVPQATVELQHQTSTSLLSEHAERNSSAP